MCREYKVDVQLVCQVLRAEQINNFSKSTMVDSRCHGNEICRIFAKNWLEVG